LNDVEELNGLNCFCANRARTIKKRPYFNPQPHHPPSNHCPIGPDAHLKTGATPSKGSRDSVPPNGLADDPDVVMVLFMAAIANGDYAPTLEI
jgi:hypothetical protein